ncbi:YdcF family protein [Flexithrix dorotheae]|uniref:YdcF family protein n=1 Tax=Flexithrix dorotheae TaxID=70993 RepID=UPI00035D1EF1|nr:YdcF family protein [Flexithrix dorotheae]
MNHTYSQSQLQQAKILFDYLYLKEPESDADAIFGFGHFDLKIPQQCGFLYEKGLAPKIVFTGGIGAGSTGLNKPEGQVFWEALNAEFPKIEKENVIIEDRSTNTGENIRFSEEILKHLNPPLHFGEQLKKLILVANAYRQRRVLLTCKKILPEMEFVNCPPETSFEQELEMYQEKGEDLIQHLVGEIHRIATYPDNDWIVKEEISPLVWENFQSLNKGQN